VVAGGWTGVFEEDRQSESLIDLCEQEQMVCLPWAPIQNVDRNLSQSHWNGGITGVHGVQSGRPIAKSP
jgi:hypothetical protein